MYINLNIEVIKIFKFELLVTTDGKPVKAKEVKNDEKGADIATSTKSK